MSEFATLRNREEHGGDEHAAGRAQPAVVHREDGVARRAGIAGAAKSRKAPCSLLPILPKEILQLSAKRPSLAKLAVPGATKPPSGGAGSIHPRAGSRSLDEPRGYIRRRTVAEISGSKVRALARPPMRGSFPTKIHLRTNANGEPLTFDVTGPEAHSLSDASTGSSSFVVLQRVTKKLPEPAFQCYASQPEGSG
jgi:hypothetical protein